MIDGVEISRPEGGGEHVLEIQRGEDRATERNICQRPLFRVDEEEGPSKDLKMTACLAPFELGRVLDGQCVDIIKLAGDSPLSLVEASGTGTKRNSSR